MIVTVLCAAEFLHVAACHFACSVSGLGHPPLGDGRFCKKSGTLQEGCQDGNVGDGARYARVIFCAFTPCSLELELHLFAGQVRDVGCVRACGLVSYFVETAGDPSEVHVTVVYLAEGS